MQKWHEKERRKAAEPRAMAVAPLSTVGISKLPGGEGKGERWHVMPKLLKSGFGHHRLASCGPPIPVTR